MIDHAKRDAVLHILKNPTKYPAGSKDWTWAIGYTAEAFALLKPTVPPVVSLTPQQTFDKIIAEAPEGTVLNLGPGEFSVTISKS